MTGRRWLGTALMCAVTVMPQVIGAQAKGKPAAGRASTPLAAPAVTQADYERATGLREKYQAAIVDIAEPATWIEKTNRFYYRKSVKGGHQFVLVDAETQQKRAAFDHEKLAATLAKLTGRKITAVTLPFNAFTFRDGEQVLDVRFDNAQWRCKISDYTCTKSDLVGAFERRQPPAPCTPPGSDARPRLSPDGKWEAFIANYNITLRPAGSKDKPTFLSTDGSEGNCYELSSVAWSPDSKKVAAYRTRPGYQRFVYYVESSPEDQLQPKHSQRLYAKPGDALDVDQPVLFDLTAKAATPIDNALFPNAYENSRLEWRKDSSAFTFEYNQRGHQVYRVIEVNAATGKARAVISEEPRTFFTYSSKKYRFDAGDGKEVIWMSERDGWNHLYLYDGVTGQVKNQITKGNWVVRGVSKVDEASRQVWFSASGMYPGQDPYFLNYYRINFDGTGLTRLTSAEANHNVSFSPDMKYYVDIYSTVSTAPVCELHRVDGSLVTVLERAELAELAKTGWKAPEVFTAMGRDGKTDIWGVIYRPTTFDARRKYPVVEYIYAGPHSSFVPKSFAAYSGMQALAELGFIVVQIDGMGTSNRSKAFHDVAWKNIKDAGFEDRILWHKAVAAKYGYYDISRVGIYGTSAGGQNSMAALLFHPEFYKAAVSAAGCHDNRMDKIWWNEQWMGWPIGPEYSASSNVDNASRLKGDLLLIVGEMDTNVDPSSTFQVVNALIKANKTFDLLVIPGAGHGEGGAYGERKRFDFFVEHLLGQTPPAWNQVEKKTTAPTSN
ncbi:MAG: DPP IV N-terminal domain-containing protein [Bacteroidales bacterium]